MFKKTEIMKTYLHYSIVFTLLLVGLCSCDKTDGEINDFFQRFAIAVQSGDKDELAKYYPEAADADSISFALNPDSLLIEKTETDGTYLVKISEGVDATVVRAADGTMTITQSHGLFAYAPDRLDFAKKTGQFKPELTDAENALRMGDTRFMDDLSERLFGEVKNNVKASCHSGGDFNHGSYASLTVRNDNDFDLPGDAYVAYAKLYSWDFDRMTDVLSRTTSHTGIPISAHSSVTYSLGTHDFEYESWKSGGVTIKTLPADVIAQIYKPTGREYDEFIAEHGAPQAVSGGDLTLDVKGLMGKCGTRLTFSGKKGTLLYNASSQSLEMAADAQQRLVSLVTYDAASGKLVLEVRNGNTVTGNLDGTYSNGTFSGKFRNVNGSSSSFSFK